MDNKEFTLGQKIKRYRLINDIRQEDMAEKLEVSRATLINYEKGHTAINIDVLERISEAFPDFEKNFEKPKIIEDNYINFAVIFSIFSDKRKSILISAFLSMIFGYIFSFSFSEKYLSEISLYPAKKDIMQGLGQLQALAVNLGTNSPKNDQDFNIADVVKSRLIASEVINKAWTTKDSIKIDLIDLWGLRKIKWYSSMFKQSVDTSIIFESAIERLKDYVFVSEDRLTGLIKISTSFEDPLISSSVANFIGLQVQNYIQKENSAQSKKEKIFISDRLMIVLGELEKNELELKNFLERNRGYEDSPELYMTFSRLSREFDAKKEVYLTLQKQLELARIEEVRMSPILHILDYAVQPIRKSYPRRLLFIISFFMVGMVSSFALQLLKY